MNDPQAHPSRNRVSCFSLFIFLLFAYSANAQEFRGSITGRVADATGASVQGAQVSATNKAINTATWATTDESGNYTILFLTPGKYDLAVEARGFKKLLRHGVEVHVGDKLTLDLALEVGEVAVTVDVTTETPLLEAATATSGQVIDRRRISELPL